MTITNEARERLENAIAQLEADITELKGHVPTWISENISGTKTYRPLAKRVVLSAKRVEELVRESTY